MAEIRLRIALTPALVRGLVVVGLFAAAGELASENINMTTYYPSPAGVYATLVTVGQTLLGTTRGVTIGGTSGVQMPGRLSVLNGSMGIGTASPSTELQVEGNMAFGADVSANRKIGMDWAGGSSNGTGFWYGISREIGPWSGSYPSLKIDFHTGVKLKAHGNYGGVSFWEDWCETGQGSCGAGGSGAGTEIVRFLINPYGGTYMQSNLAVGSYGNAAAALDVQGEGVGIFREPGSQCYTIRTDPLTGLAGGCGGGTYATSQSGVYSRVTPGMSILCCQCPVAGCPSLP